MSHKEDAPIVSVVMAVYNGSRYLADAVDSILNQSYPNLELIVIDDGSTDGSDQILAQYRDSRIKNLSNTSNKGLAYSLNRGLAEARGIFVARQDADDVSLPERFERQVAFLNSNPDIGLVGTGSRWVNDSGDLIRDWNPPVDSAQIQQTILRALPVLHATIMFRKDCLDCLDLYYDEKYPVAQDTDFLFRFSEPCDISNIADVLYVVRTHEASTTSRKGEEQQSYLKKAQMAAVQRRLDFGWSRLGMSATRYPAWVGSASRRWLAERYVWWSACTRAHSKKAAFQMLLISLLLDPGTPDIRRYLQGIFKRKLGVGKPDAERPWFD